MTGLELLGLAMLVVMLGAIFIGLPISFTLLFLAGVFGYIGMGPRVLSLAYLQTIGIMKQDELVAVPMFILMGFVCDQAGLMERLFKAFRDLFAPMKGALYVVVIVTATLFGIAAGTVGATVALLGIMAGPMMIRSGYDVRMSAGAIAAGGTLGILIPPSVMLVVMAPVLDISIIDLYAAAFGPGFLLSAMFIAYTLVRCYINPKLGPPVPVEERPESMKIVLWECLVGLVPVTVLTVVTLGAILAGITTAAEAAALGALGAILLVVGYGKFTWNGLLQACYSTLATTSMVLLLAVASNVFGAVFAWLGTASWMTNALLASPLPPWGTMTLLLDADLPARLAVRMAGDRVHFPADAGAGGKRPRLRHGVVRLHRRGRSADRLPVAAGGDVGLLSQAGGEGVEPAADLSRHGRLHGHPGTLRDPGLGLPGDRDVVPELAAGPPGCRSQEGADRVCGAGGGHRFGGQGKLRGNQGKLTFAEPSTGFRLPNAGPT